MTLIGLRREAINPVFEASIKCMVVSCGSIKLAAFTFGLLISASSFGEAVYKWTDEKGVTHYGSTKPSEDVNPSKIKISGNGPSDKEAAAKRLEASRKQFTESSDGSKEQNPLDNPEQLKEQRKKNCDQAQGNLKMLESGERLRMQGDEGEESVITDEQREAELKRNKAYIDAYCSDLLSTSSN